ncbi:MAG: phosphatase PAP2 family protein [Bacillus sp. (in: firmicutes)]
MNDKKEKLRTMISSRYMIMLSALILLFLLVFIVFADKVQKNELQQFDYTIIEFIQSRISEQLTVWMKAITFLGGKHWVVPALLISSVLIALYRKRYAVFLLATTAFGSVLNIVLKAWFHRERPDFHVLIEQGGYSFPSGHSMGAFIFYTALMIVLVKISKRRSVDWVIGCLFALLILAIGISRIYLGVHYPSDVVAGYAAGGFWVCLCSLALRYYERQKEMDEHL